MTDKEYLEEKKRVEKVYRKWRDHIGLGWWRITLEFSREKQDAGVSLNYAPKDVAGSFECVMQVSADYFYKEARITAFLPVTKNQKDEELERCFLHECMHIFLKAMSTKEKADQEELVATTLADALLWAVQAAEEGKLKVAKNKT